MFKQNSTDYKLLINIRINQNGLYAKIRPKKIYADAFRTSEMSFFIWVARSWAELNF